MSSKQVNSSGGRRLNMRKRRYTHRFTPEQVAELAKNPFTRHVSACTISYTLEFKNLFLTYYEKGVSVKDTFAALGYDPEILGEGRMYSFANKLVNQIEKGEPLSETPSFRQAEKMIKVDYNTMPAQQSVAAMQRELTYLRQQVEFLKKISQLDTNTKLKK